MRSALALLVAAAAAAAPAPARAHIVYARSTLAQFAEQAELAVVAEFRSGPKLWAAADGSDREEYYEIRVVETLKGSAGAERIEFFPHAEGFPSYAAGERALVFLDRTEGHAEFAGAALRFAWFSTQGPGQEWRLAGAEAAPVLAAARGWAGVAKSPGAVAPAGRRELLAAVLGSGIPRLESDALVELVRTGGALLADADGVAPFAALASSRSLRAPVRLPLVRLLDGRGGFEAAPVLLAMTREPLTPAELALLVQVAGGLRDARFSLWLAGVAKGDDAALRLAAVRALGQPWHAPAVPTLAPLAVADDPTLARAALQSLAAIGTPEARTALETAAASSTDPQRKSWAEAALRRLDLGAPAP
ncbi:MAG TPA: HEAT repeat domain-containing protein [Myxococcota bacterium]|nr:HEAT repeat domain-containing protein [Myxococcota bacterium]